MPGVGSRTTRRARTMIACPGCGFQAPDDFAFCPRCASPLAAAREIFARLGARPALAETDAVLADAGLAPGAGA